MNSERELFLATVNRHLGLPYIWGGDDSIYGLDCSGLVIEGLKTIGKLKEDEDMVAHDLCYGLFKSSPSPSINALRPGDLVFYGSPKVIHVEIVYDRIAGKVYAIGAMGGGSKTLTKEDAIKQNAYIKIRPLKVNYVMSRNIFGD